MTTIVGVATGSGNDVDSPGLIGVGSAPAISHSSTSVVLDLGEGETLTLTGTAFGGFTGQGIPTTGTVTGLTDPGGGHWSNFNISVPDLWTIFHTGDVDAFDDAFFASNDTFVSHNTSTLSENDDHFSGFAGNDTFNMLGASAGTFAHLYGGDGNDVFRFAANLNHDADSIDGGTGTDTVTLNGNYAAGFVFTATTMINVETLILGAGHSYKLSTSAGTVALGQMLTVNATVLGASYNLNFNGTAESDGRFKISGGAGNDKLSGGSGNDTLNGGLGNDTLTGAAGNDVFVVNVATDIVTELLNAGTDTIQSSVSYSLVDTDAAGINGGNIENLTLLGVAANGIGNALKNLLTGNGASNVLQGNEGNDTLSGGAGADTLRGGLGDDRYLRSAGDVLQESVNAGTDLVFSDNSFTLVANFEKLVLTGSGDFYGNGNSLANSVTGNGGNNLLHGYVGNDTVNGGAGDDLLDGGTGDDRLNGGDGDDVIIDVAGNDKLDGGLGTDLASFFYSTGVVFANLKYGSAVSGSDFSDILLNIENVSGSNGFGDALTGNELANLLLGNGGNDSIAGNEGNDTLNGGAGSDRLFGGAGNDTYYVDDVSDEVNENYYDGIDLIYSSVNRTLEDGQENLTLTGALAINGTGNYLDNVITGNSIANVLYGDSGNDTLAGGGGADAIDGGTNDDVLTGGDGNDAFVFDTALSVFSLTTNGTLVGDAVVTATNGIAVEANLQFQTAAGTTAVISYATGSGADAIAAAINTGGAAFGLTAVASNTATLGQVVLIGGATTFSVTLNGSAISANVTNASDLSNLITTINARSPFTGVSASFANPGNMSVITLTSSDGRDISLQNFGSTGANDTFVLTGFDGTGTGAVTADGTNSSIAVGTVTVTASNGPFTLTGANADVFTTVTSTFGGAINLDTITDFLSGTDKIHLDDDIFLALNADTSTTLTEGQFASGAGLSSAQDASDRIIYDTTTGLLYYDADGTDSANPAIAFAQLGTTTHPTLTISDFVVIA